MRKTAVLLGAIMLVLLSSPQAEGADKKFYKKLQEFISANFPGEGFIANPYGADARFKPKTIWIYGTHVLKQPWKTGTQKAWLVASNGESIYPESLVPIVTDQIDPETWKIDKDSKWGLAASLAGKIDLGSIDADLDLAIQNGLEVSIDLGTVEVQYAYYFDMVMAQDLNGQILVIYNKILKEQHGEIPDRRVMTAAIRVKDAEITVNTANGSKLDLGLGLGTLLGKLGLNWDKNKKVYRSLKTTGWKYIAYQALLADKETGTIGYSPVESDQAYTYPDENLGWACKWCQAQPN